MKLIKKSISIMLVGSMLLSLCACSASSKTVENTVPNQDNTQIADSTTIAPTGATTTNDKAVTLSFGGTAAAEDTITLAMQKVKELAYEKSGGSITINLFPSSQLGGAAEQIEGVITGSQDMFVDAGGYLSEYIPDRKIASYFWIFETPEHYKNFTESDLSKKWDQECIDQFGLRVLSTNWFRQPSAIATKTPVNTMADIKGMKIRVPQASTSIDCMKAIGAIPTAISYSEVYLSLNQGVIDATVGTKDAMYTMSFYTAVDNITLTNHTFDSVYCMINEGVFAGLSENQQKALIEACQETGVWYTKVVEETVEDYYKTIEESGTNIIDLTDAAKQEFVDAVGAVCKQKESEGEWTQGLYDEIKGMK